MAAEDSQILSTEDPRPQTARKDSRKVPGGFGIDDLDDLSPTKNSFDESALTNSQAVSQNDRLPSLDLAGLPSLPPPEDSSLLYSHSENGEHNMDEVDEKAMQRHLNDVESSFMPAISPIGVATNKGADDTFLFDGLPAQSERLSPIGGRETPSDNGQSNRRPPDVSPPTPPNAYKTPGHSRYNSLAEETSFNIGDTTSSLETMSSSPTAAAAARTVSKAILQAGKEVSEQSYSGDASNNADRDGKSDSPSQILDEASDTDDRSTLRYHLSSHSLAADAGNTPGHALLNHRTGKRPKYLRSRHGSQRSSISSFITDPDLQDGSELGLGTDFALQSGGAVPSGGVSRSTSYGLSRSISLGSMASGIEDYSATDLGAQTGDGALATLTEEQQNQDRLTQDESSAPNTPRASSRSLTAPTDTIIARHVRNVKVPESLAKEYRNKSGTMSPKRSSFAAVALGRNGKNLTLKEQSSTIERLSKENFDLKLKVMFLSDRLDKLSEEGVKEMISENVELKTGLAVMQRDNKALKRKVKELEEQVKDGESRPSTAHSTTSNGESSPPWYDQESAQEREEELLYLRERVEEYVTEIDKLRNDGAKRENEKRNLADLVRSMGERRGQNVESREEMDVWKDLLEQETARREQGDEENKRLREEILRLKTEPASNPAGAGLNHTTNIYNITKKRSGSPSRPLSGLSGQVNEDRNGTFSSASTLVEELRKESEQLRHENTELRREVGAQTSMLTSRNREKERLYQEIEDLKLGIRRGAGSVAGESIFDRSASRAGISRAHERSHSRASVGTRQTTMDDTEREDLENKHSELRDKINSLKIHNQDLQRELESCMEDFEIAVEQKKEADALASELQEALEVAEGDLLTMQTDRDEALQGQEEAEIMFESLRKEAQEELDGFAADADESAAEIERLQAELSDTTENFNALQNEMRQMSEALVRLEDDQEHHVRRIQELGKEVTEANGELEHLEKNLVEANEKINRLLVQQESSQSEISFLREEQDADKIKIGDMEAAIKALENSLNDEMERAKELDQRLANERHQREVVAGREKQEVQQYINELNRESSHAKDESRKLRQALTTQEVEAAEWKQRLLELENNLREALGDLNGTRSSLLNSIAKLRRELEDTMRDLDNSKASVTEKERLINKRDSLLESHALESRKLADMLEKERQLHRNTKHQFETFQKTQQHTTRTLTQQEARVLELETSRQQDRRKLVTLENNFKDQMAERNNLLLALWNRLSTLCGTDWAHNNSLINGRALPTIEAITNMLPGFAKNLMAAVKTIESIVGEFKLRIRGIEKDLYREYQTLESNLEIRTKRLDRLETMSRSAIPGVGSNTKRELEKLRDVNRNLKLEISTLRAANDVVRQYEGQSPSPSVPTGPRHKAHEKTSRTSTMTRHHSTSAIETLERVVIGARSGTSSGSGGGDIEHSANIASVGSEEYKPDLKWQVRLQELEYKLKAEREARKLDRSSARQRLEEKNRENAELKSEMERNRVREQR